MKKKLQLISIFLLSTISFGQVGIETAFPKGSFHIDGNKDNPKDATTSLSSVQQANDFIVLPSTGRVGVGTIIPTTQLDVNNGTSNGAIKIVDGNQGQGKFLMSDTNGLATWKTPNSFKSSITWVYNGTPEIINVQGKIISTSSNDIYDGDGRIYSNLSLIGLTKGKWIINIGVTLNTEISLSDAFWMHANLSSLTSSINLAGWKNLGPAGNNTGYAGTIFGDGTVTGKGFLSGTTIIEVTSSTPINMYLLFEKIGKYSFNTSSPENYFYAIPIN